MVEGKCSRRKDYGNPVRLFELKNLYESLNSFLIGLLGFRAVELNVSSCKPLFESFFPFLFRCRIYIHMSLAPYMGTGYAIPNFPDPIPVVYLPSTRIKFGDCLVYPTIWAI